MSEDREAPPMEEYDGPYCETCRFFDPLPLSEGHCRRHAPQPIDGGSMLLINLVAEIAGRAAGNPDAAQYDMPGYSTLAEVVTWQKVEAADWCGEHKPRKRRP